MNTHVLLLTYVCVSREAAGVPDHVRPEELISPLRAVNNMSPVSLTKDQAASATYIASLSGTQLTPEAADSSNDDTQPNTPATPMSPSKVAVPLPGNAQAPPSCTHNSHHVQLNRQDSHACRDQDRCSYKGGCHAQHDQSCASAGGGGVQGHGPCSHHDSSDCGVVCGDADVGLMALWGLLNMSGYGPAQVSICKHGLYTLLRVVNK